VAASCVVLERINAGRVVATSCFISQCINTDGGVVTAGCILCKRLKADGRVFDTACLEIED